ncbi:MAG: hypothetical protein HQK78_20195, partial [Desulfobacterales bacterium]|nr:hypothetical protein [Desulfobacterales bacterium]
MTFFLDNYKKRTLSRDLIVGLVIITITITTFLEGLYYLYSTYNLNKELENKSKYITEELSKVISAPIWNLDIDTTVKISEAYLNSQHLK